MSKQYLDYTGLSRYDSNIKDWVDDVVEDSVLPLIPSVGSISSGNTGYVTGGDVYTALSNIGPTGPGVPTGGTSGQVLAKASGADFDTEWITSSGFDPSTMHDMAEDDYEVRPEVFVGKASATEYGVVKLGQNISLDNKDRIQVIYPVATASSQGIMQVGSSLSVSNGTVSVIDASTSQKGVVQIGSGLDVISGIISVSLRNLLSTMPTENETLIIPTVATSIASGDTGYATGDQVYNAINN